MRTTLAAAVLVPALLALPVPSGAAAAPARATLTTASDTAGDVQVSGAGVPAAQVASVDLVRVDAQRRKRKIRVTFVLAGPPLSDGYSSAITFHAKSRKGTPHHKSLGIYLEPQNQKNRAVFSYRDRVRRDCFPKFVVAGTAIQIDVPRKCVPQPFAGPVEAETELYQVRAGSTPVATDELEFPGDPGLPGRRS